MFNEEMTNLSMDGLSLFQKPNQQDYNDSVAFLPPEFPCKDVNCGEGGCAVIRGRPICFCDDPEMTETDVNGSCNRTVKNPVDTRQISHETGGQNPMPNGPQRPHPSKSTITSLTTQESMSSVHIPTLQIVLPILIILTIICLVLVMLYVRMRRRRSRTPKSEKSWIHKQDSVSLLENMIVVSRNPQYLCSHDVEDVLLAELRDKHVPRDKMKLLEEVGEGAFGKVYKGEVAWEEDNVVQVAVKILKSDASRETREDFRREVKIMSSFDHKNILRLIGIVPTDDSPYMIFEYMEHGDLTEVLRSNDPSTINEKLDLKLKQTELIDIATQVANGMVYLASRHFVHRDLATRNCLVGTELNVKISDFGMSRDIYTCDYYKIGGARMLPVRWMSPESVKYGRFTTESDVWAYGVILWEIFTFGKQPYFGHANEEVIRFIDDGILLQKPKGCPETIYHIMLGCWRRSASERFSFERIYNLLVEYQRKIMKYARHVSSEDVADVEEA